LRQLSKFFPNPVFGAPIRHRSVTEKSNIGKNQRKFKKMEVFRRFGTSSGIHRKTISPLFAGALGVDKIL